MIKRVLALLVILSFTIVSQTQALTSAQQYQIDTDTEFYNGTGPAVTTTAPTVCSGNTTATTTTTTGSSNLDYAGQPILNQGELAAVAKNEQVYQEAAQQYNLPWQLLAAIHYRETDFSTNGADAGPNGQYQNTYENYPYTGPLTTQEFLQETDDAAALIKSDGTGITASSDEDTIGTAMLLYNGNPALYQQQAVNLGYTAPNEAFEGSPYVMNFADAARDPTKAAPGTWLQYITSTEIASATPQFGAYLVYADLTGTSLPSGGNGGGGCSTGSVSCTGSNSNTSTTDLSPIQQNIVCIAEQELAAWENGTMQPGFTPNSPSSFSKYTDNNDEEWCADFASWVYAQAGDAFGPGGERDSSDPTDVPYVGNLQPAPAGPQDASKFVEHAAAGYTPQPGDLALHYDPSQSLPWYHVNIVVSVSPGEITLVGGDQEGGGSPETNVVSTETVTSSTGDNILDYVGPS